MTPNAVEVSGAGEGNRTPVTSLGSLRSTIELHPRCNTKIENLSPRAQVLRGVGPIGGAHTEN